MKIGIIGLGYWGEKILNKLIPLFGKDIVICDTNQKKLHDLLNLYSLNPSGCYQDFRFMLDMACIDAVIITTPAETHYEIASEAIKAHKHIFIEKPLCLQIDNVDALSDQVKLFGKIFFINHVYLHSNCIRFIKSLIDNNALGTKIHYFHSIRTNLGAYRKHNVVWDLGPHDLSIIKYLFKDYIVSEIKATCHSNYSPLEQGIQDTAFINISFFNDFSASIFLSWCYPKKIRDVVIMGNTSGIIYENNNRVIVFKHNLCSPFKLTNIKKDIIEEYTQEDDPLTNSLNSFLDCIKKNTLPPIGSSIDFAKEIINLLSLSQNPLLS